VAERWDLSMTGGHMVHFKFEKDVGLSLPRLGWRLWGYRILRCTAEIQRRFIMIFVFLLSLS
jgi:hypothetical protein